MQGLGIKYAKKNGVDIFYGKRNQVIITQAAIIEICNVVLSWRYKKKLRFVNGFSGEGVGSC
ncbi:hypothetical protein D3C75_1282800 [compost metagenome]